ncbi:glycosyltransferase family 4 protein [Aeromonas caviae]|uniref:glycosyltransferase family 4 protein n=1 Tax=Aeromonas caviae TaxID=648 RepID=UPI002447892B|nr:glycosyltransferase family 4 protein [Aeromonas caviae]MDH0318262.1 glycosyltransferase family 4 protein [Aeromonas caviae]
MSLHVCMVANTAWSMWNFRRGLISSLVLRGYRITIVAPSDHTVPWLCELGCSFIPLRLSAKGTNPFIDLRTMWELIKIYGDFDIDLAIHYTVKPNIYGSFAAHYCRLPTLAITTGLGYAFLSNGWVSRVVMLLYKYALKYPRIVVFLNKDDRDEFILRGLVDESKTLLFPGEGVDLDFFHPSDQSVMKTDGELCFLLIARLLWDKGIGEYVEAAKKIRSIYPNVKFQLLGDVQANNPSAIDHNLLSEWIDEGILEYLGTTDDVRPIIMQSDCVVLPSYREGVPRTILEAAAMAKPIIVSNVPGCRDVVQHGNTGLLCQARSVMSLTCALTEFIKMPSEQRISMGNAGRQFIASNFDEKKVNDIYLNLIEHRFDVVSPSEQNSKRGA